MKRISILTLVLIILLGNTIYAYSTTTNPYDSPDYQVGQKLGAIISASNGKNEVVDYWNPLFSGNLSSIKKIAISSSIPNEQLKEINILAASTKIENDFCQILSENGFYASTSNDVRTGFRTYTNYKFYNKPLEQEAGNAMAEYLLTSNYDALLNIEIKAYEQNENGAVVWFKISMISFNNGLPLIFSREEIRFANSAGIWKHATAEGTAQRIDRSFVRDFIAKKNKLVN